MNEIKLHIRALYIVFLFVNTGTNDFTKEIKHLIGKVCENPRAGENPGLFIGLSLMYSRISRTFASVFARLQRHEEHVF